MQIIFFGTEIEIINEWKARHSIEISASIYDLDSLFSELEKSPESVLMVDYDSVANEVNKLISSGKLPTDTIVLERAPEIATGKMLISHGVKAYGNSRMLSVHYMQMLETVLHNKVWTYPELTASLTQDSASPSMNEDSMRLIENRLSPKELEVVHFILDGLTNDAISSKLDITVRTVKAHVGSIFTKLHVSDRISLVLLLR